MHDAIEGEETPSNLKHVPVKEINTLLLHSTLGLIFSNQLGKISNQLDINGTFVSLCEYEY